jgi:hypothetical protein
VAVCMAVGRRAAYRRHLRRWREEATACGN